MMGRQGKFRVRIFHPVFVWIARKSGKTETQLEGIQALGVLCWLAHCLCMGVFVCICACMHCGCCVRNAKHNQPQNPLCVKPKIYCSLRNLITAFDQPVQLSLMRPAKKLWAPGHIARIAGISMKFILKIPFCYDEGIWGNECILGIYLPCFHWLLFLIHPTLPPSLLSGNS